jgi:isopentenyl-diphosphate delta-isomerase
MEQQLLQVDASDQVVGTVEKMKAHREGILHRAFSVFLFTPDGRWILQQRARSKYHSGGLWSNACCGHPLMNEDTPAAARRRLHEEMGVDCSLNEIFSFTYRAELQNGLIEHEVDHVFTGITTAVPAPDPQEVMAWKLVRPDEVRADVLRNDRNYTEWFKMIVERILHYQKQNA